MTFRSVALAALLAVAAGPALAQVKGDKATAPEAEAMVKKAVAFIQSTGPEKAYAEFGNKQGQFTDRDLYIVVYGLDGKVLAHGANAKLVGKDLMDAQDVDGVYYVRERVAKAKAEGKFWQDYKFTNPVSRKIEPKRMYCERVAETAVCGGIYKS
jgi:signal transduction histidine kinase